MARNAFEKASALLPGNSLPLAMLVRVNVAMHDLAKVKETFLRARETELRNNEFWMDWLAKSYRYGDDPTLVLDTAPILARMTSDNVKAAAKRYLDLGVTHFCIGTDMSILYEWFSHNGKAMRELVGDAGGAVKEAEYR